MKISVHSKYPLSTREKSWITNIFFESQNPNESLSNTFGERYHHMFEGDPTEVFLDGPDGHFSWSCEVEVFC